MPGDRRPAPYAKKLYHLPDGRWLVLTAEELARELADAPPAR